MIYLNGTPLNVTMFPDNTSQVWKLHEQTLKESNYAHVTWEFQHEGEFMHLAQLRSLLRINGIKTDLKLKYLPYGRQDKRIANDATFALWTFATLLNFLGFNEVVCMDPHSLIAADLIMNFKAVYPLDQVMKIAYDLNIDLFAYPDAGAVDKYTGGEDVQKEIYDYPCIYGEKVRDQATGNITSYKLIGSPADKKVLIVDDICDGGMTFKLLTKDLLAAGATEVHLFVTHGIFSKGLGTLFESGIKRIFTQDGEASTHQNQITYRRL